MALRVYNDLAKNLGANGGPLGEPLSARVRPNDFDIHDQCLFGSTYGRKLFTTVQNTVVPRFAPLLSAQADLLNACFTLV